MTFLYMQKIDFNRCSHFCLPSANMTPELVTNAAPNLVKHTKEFPAMANTTALVPGDGIRPSKVASCFFSTASASCSLRVADLASTWKHETKGFLAQARFPSIVEVSCTIEQHRGFAGKHRYSSDFTVTKVPRLRVLVLNGDAHPRTHLILFFLPTNSHQPATS